jgi:hypothetical protein
MVLIHLFERLFYTNIHFIKRLFEFYNKYSNDFCLYVPYSLLQVPNTKPLDKHDLSGFYSPACGRWLPPHSISLQGCTSFRHLTFHSGIVCHQPRLHTTRVALFLHFPISNLIPFRLPRLSQTCNLPTRTREQAHFIPPYRAIPAQEPHLPFTCTHP